MAEIARDFGPSGEAMLSVEHFGDFLVFQGDLKGLFVPFAQIRCVVTISTSDAEFARDLHHAFSNDEIRIFGCAARFELWGEEGDADQYESTDETAEPSFAIHQWTSITI